MSQVPMMGMGMAMSGSSGPAGEVRLSPPPDPMNWYKIRGCGGASDVVWMKKGVGMTDMNIMQNYVFRNGAYMQKAPCPIIPKNGKCPAHYVPQTQCPSCSVGPGPRCELPCRIMCVPVGTPCPMGSVCDGMPVPTPGGPGDYTGTCGPGEHFSHCGCVCRKDGSIEPLCYEFCPTPGHAGMPTNPGHGCVDNVLCIRGAHWSPTACRCVSDTPKCSKGARWSPCFQKCRPGGLLEPSPNSSQCVQPPTGGPGAMGGMGAGAGMMMPPSTGDMGMMMPPAMMPPAMMPMMMAPDFSALITQATNWVKANPLIAGGVVVVVIFLLMSR